MTRLSNLDTFQQIKEVAENMQDDYNNYEVIQSRRSSHISDKSNTKQKMEYLEGDNPMHEVECEDEFEEGKIHVVQNALVRTL